VLWRPRPGRHTPHNLAGIVDAVTNCFEGPGGKIGASKNAAITCQGIEGSERIVENIQARPLFEIARVLVRFDHVALASS
jgi:hypothetical protein